MLGQQADVIVKDVHKISDVNGWKEGSTEKAILHAVVGGITAKLGGDHFAAGASSGAVNEVVNGVIAEYGEKITPDMHQWLSAMVGVIVNNAIGQTLQTGAAEAVYGTKWNKFGHGRHGEKIEEVALAVETERFGHTSLVIGFEDGTYQEGNFGRYAGDHSTISGSVPNDKMMQGTYLFDDNYKIGCDNKTVYFLNKSAINANNVAWAYNNTIDVQGYQYGLTKFLEGDKPQLDKNRKPEYYYRIPGSLTDYQLLGHNCVTTSVDPLFAGVQFDWTKDMSPAAQTLRLLRMAISPYEVNNILKEDYRKYHGTGLVSRIGE